MARDKYRVEKIMWTVMGAVLVFGMVLLVYTSLTSTPEAIKHIKENEGYTRYVACVIEVRNTEKVVAIGKDASDVCWDLAEKEMGIKLHRYSEVVK